MMIEQAGQSQQKQWIFQKKILCGKKAAIEAKNLKRVHDANGMETPTAINCLLDKLREIGSVTITAAKYRSDENKYKVIHDFKLRKAEDELIAAGCL